MPLQKLDQWASSRVQQSFQLSTLKDAVIGVDASYYLDLRVNGKAAEPLKPALGGVPYMLKEDLKEDLLELKEADVRVIFVFPGLEYVNKSPSESQSQETTRAAENAWMKYRSKKEDEVVKEFSKAKYPIDTLYRYLQELLIENGVEFLVAPFSAVAQLSYMVKLSEQYIDAVWGSTELFLFDVDKVITNLKIPSDKSSQVTFDWISKATCEERLKVPPDVLRDAQLLCGTSFSLPFPILERQAAGAKVISISDAIAMLNTSGRSVLQLCNMYREDHVVSQLDYADRYKKSIMTIRHHIILESNGTVAPLDFAHAPGDVHDFVGQNLPEELFFYISRGLIGPEVPSWLASGEINLSLPGGVPDNEPYRHLVIEQLNPIRTQALRILSEPLNYYYKGRTVKIRTWDGRDTENLTIILKEEPDMRPKLNQWKVRGAELTTLLNKSSHGSTLLACLQGLRDDNFIQKSFTTKNVPHPALRTLEEISANTFWRFLQIRGYVSDTHKLTKWGEVLETVLNKLVPKFESVHSAEDAALLAVELLRLGLLNGHEVDGTVISPADKDVRHKTNLNLISKIACLGRFNNKAQGYVGPLDRQLLSFAWMLTSLRTSLRVLMESVVVSMFLTGDVERDRHDWSTLAMSMPLISDTGAALGVVARTYLDSDELKVDDSKITPEIKTQLKSLRGDYAWFKKAVNETLKRDLRTVWRIWEAVFAGVGVLGKEGGKEREAVGGKMWEEGNEWVSVRY